MAVIDVPEHVHAGEDSGPRAEDHPQWAPRRYRSLHEVADISGRSCESDKFAVSANSDERCNCARDA